jgi:acetylornithine deacetylase/succinyl-diaminopimelate desuccinylase-like protein
LVADVAEARPWFEEKLAALNGELGGALEHHYDAAVNHWVTLVGESEKALVVGSHLDSVPNGGWLACVGRRFASYRGVENGKRVVLIGGGPASARRFSMLTHCQVD